MPRFPALRGALLALLAAVLFGVSTPLIQHFGKDVNAWMTAGLLYAGAALAGLLLRASASREAALRRAQIPRLLLMTLFGAVLGPVLLAWGLQRSSGTAASLMLTLEAVLTMLLASALYREQIDRRVGIALLLITLGGIALVLDGARGGTAQWLGLLAVLGATLAWSIDNSLSRKLADSDPGQVVLAKAAVGACCSFLMAVLAEQTSVSLLAAASLFVIGAAGYGLSLRFYLLAQRAFGAARTGSVFASAPFIGALIALALGDRAVSGWMGFAAALMMAGTALHLAEEHEHEHQHEPLDHEHAHSHDDGHHLHAHEPMPAGPHSHLHQHAAHSHRHPHVPDLHHAHRH